MRLHSISTTTERGTSVVVTAGWDGRRSGFLLFVHEAKDGGASGDLVFSNLDLPADQLTPKDFGVFGDFLKRLGIALPTPMVEEVGKDAFRAVIDRRVIWTADGQHECIEEVRRA